MPTTTAAHPAPPIAIIVSRYNESITRNLTAGAVAAYTAAGGQERNLAIIEAAGAFEIPVLVQEAALSDAFRAIIALGCIVRGETDHDRYLSDAVTKALLDLSLEHGVPIGLGVLTVNSIDQAIARSGGPSGTAPGNKGAEAMQAALATLAAVDTLLQVGEGQGDPGVRFALPAAPADKAAATHTPRRSTKPAPRRAAPSRSTRKARS